ncbi:general stress protein [Euzebyella marina]|uniref:General stress protein n=1 Tax=Euzebyella marina TaxID=1761453 RepID=A0A3G2L5R8_9FLAO|nr:pyridoxamine 5'-phosphate oxidase family protein [Euzebyella marina]AYN67607.1 general stress protein [Euzebyella marina]
MSTEHLFDKEAKDKLKELAEGIDIALMETNLIAKQTHMVPMSTKEVDEDGAIWFLSNKDSQHNQNLNIDNELQLIYAKPGDMEFMTIYGQASITSDKAVLKKYYGKMDDTWFEGIDDPNLTAIKVVPKQAYYWDTKFGKFTSFLKMGVGILTGEKQDLGEEGHLKL